jgi:hypothetical protein
MGLLIVSYGLQYLDKTSLAYSAILGLSEDLVRIFHIAGSFSFGH